jgi:hypothetical protein
MAAGLGERRSWREVAFAITEAHVVERPHGSQNRKEAFAADEYD